MLRHATDDYLANSGGRREAVQQYERLLSRCCYGCSGSTTARLSSQLQTLGATFANRERIGLRSARSGRKRGALISAPKGVAWYRHPFLGELLGRAGNVHGRLAAGAFASVRGVAKAQQASTLRIGILPAGLVPITPPAAFRDELRERGGIEGQNLVIERRGGDGHSDRVAILAAELVRMKLDVIVTSGASRASQ